MNNDDETPYPHDDLKAIFAKRLRAREARIRKLLPAFLIMGIGVMGAAFSVIGFVNLVGSKSPAVTNKPAFDFIPLLAADIKDIKKEIESLQSTVAVLQKPPAEAAVTIEQARLSSSVGTLQQRVQALADAIMESPERALSLPLLRKDVQDIALRLEESRTATRTEFDRLHSQQKWMLGGIGTVLLTVAASSLTFILTSLAKGKDREEKSMATAKE